MTAKRPTTRIQRKNTETILDAALDVFSQNGYRGATLDQIARAANLSKPNLLYYFPSKEAIYKELLSGLMNVWLAPLEAMNADGEPIPEIVDYVLRKLTMAQELPRESRLFANEIIRGAPNILNQIEGDLRALVTEKAALIAEWSRTGRIAPLDPYHLIFSIWATTQHYADFDVQVRAILPDSGDDRFQQAATFLENFYRQALAPK